MFIYTIFNFYYKWIIKITTTQNETKVTKVFMNKIKFTKPKNKMISGMFINKIVNV